MPKYELVPKEILDSVAQRITDAEYAIEDKDESRLKDAIQYLQTAYEELMKNRTPVNVVPEGV